MDLRMHPGYERELLQLPSVDAALDAAADAVVEAAQEGAPKLTGASAATIHWERSEEARRVSWEPEKYWLRFAELGTEHQPATPFLRPAADAPANTNQ